MRFKSIRTKLIAFICVLIALCILVLQVVNLGLLNSAFGKLVPATLDASLQNAHTQVQAKLDANFSSLETIARMPVIRDTNLSLKERAATLKDFIAYNTARGYVATAITDTNGAAVLTSGYEIDVSGDDYFQEAIQGNNTVSDPFYSVATGDLIIVYAVPYYDAAGSIAGVITLDTDALHLSQDFTVEGLGDTGVAFAITKQGNTVVSTDPQTVADQLNDLEEALEDLSLEGLVASEKRMIAGEWGSAEHVYKGKQEIIHFMPVVGTTWSLAVTQERAEAFGVLHTVRTSGLVVLVVLAALGGCAAVALARSISRPILRLVEAAAGLAAGDTAQALALEKGGQDEIGRLTDTFLEMSEGIEIQTGILRSVARGDLTVHMEPRGGNDALAIALERMLADNNHTLGEVNQVAEKVTVGAHQISQGGNRLAQSCIEQSVSVDHISKEMTEMKTRVLGSLEMTDQAMALSAEVEANLRESGESMTEMISAMEHIRSSSGNISGIIEVIDDIAFQTNILALNAAVEAARAGQNGKGFAVVAHEVRSLASKSAQAACQTAELIQESIRNVGHGAKIAEHTSQAMNQLADSLGGIITRIAEIAAMSREQAESIALINEEVAQINGTTHMSAATAEQSASSSQELLEMARHMQELIAFYKLSKDCQPTTPLEVAKDVSYPCTR